MNTPPRNALIDNRLSGLTPGTLRYQVLQALRAFRASWVELGRHLNEVVYGGDYKDWGYDDFEVYCARELGLKKPTVQKLMISYNYMKKHEAVKLVALDEKEPGSPATVPDYQTVELLDRVRRAESLPEKEVNQWHKRVFDEGGDDDNEVVMRRELRQLLRPRLASDDSTEDGKARAKELTGILNTARELRKRLSAAACVPAGLRERLDNALTELEALA